MAAKALTDAELRHAYRLVKKLGGIKAAADVAKVDPGTFRNRYNRALTRLGLPPIEFTHQGRVQYASLDEEREAVREKTQRRDLKQRHDEALKTIERLETELSAASQFGAASVNPVVIKPKISSRKSEGTVVWVASDWHSEERVEPRSVSGLNTHNLEIGKRRAAHFFRIGTRLTQILQQDCTISRLILALIGDFISNDIHDELVEVADAAPVDAILVVTNLIAGGIEYVLTHSQLEIDIICKSGNHGRTTKTTRFATETGHSLESLMYHHLAAYFRHEKRVRFHINEGYHEYVEVYDQTLRFHHGHAIRYAGGVGGITIPVNKAIAQWNKGRKADLDVFGHFHQYRDGGNFICNGSQIGFNPYALSIKADYEEPKQALFLLDRDLGRTSMWPILYRGV